MTIVQATSEPPPVCTSGNNPSKICEADQICTESNGKGTCAGNMNAACNDTEGTGCGFNLECQVTDEENLGKGNGLCKLVDITFCTADVKKCYDGTFRSRKHDNNCEFDPPCPVLPKRDVGENCGLQRKNTQSPSCLVGLECHFDEVSRFKNVDELAGYCVDMTICRADVKKCYDGTFRSPNPDNNCKFDPPCPVLPKRDVGEICRRYLRLTQTPSCLVGLQCIYPEQVGKIIIADQVGTCQDVGQNVGHFCGGLLGEVCMDGLDCISGTCTIKPTETPVTVTPVTVAPPKKVCEPSVDNAEYCKCPEPVTLPSGKIEISVCGDATFLIPEGSIPCSGTTLQHGAVCPKMDDTTTIACKDRNIFSFYTGGKNGICKAPSDAQCMLLNTGVYGCVFHGNANTVNMCLDVLPVSTAEYQVDGGGMVVQGNNGYPVLTQEALNAGIVTNTAYYLSPVHLSVDSSGASDNTSIYAFTTTSFLAIVLLATL